MHSNQLFYRYWEYAYLHAEDFFYPVSGPRNIAHYGLPPELHNMDDAFVWGGDGRTYFFKGDKYWGQRADGIGIDYYHYRRDIFSVWGGIPNDIDAAFKWQGDEKTYFFKGKDYYRFNDRYRYVEYGYPIALGWFDCPAEAANLVMMVKSPELSTPVSVGNNTDNNLSKGTMFLPDHKTFLFIAFASGLLMI